MVHSLHLDSDRLRAVVGKLPASPRLRFDTVAGWWVDRFEAKVAGGERHPRTLEAHRYQLDCHLLPALGRRRIASLMVDNVAELGARGAARFAGAAGFTLAHRAACEVGAPARAGASGHAPGKRSPA